MHVGLREQSEEQQAFWERHLLETGRQRVKSKQGKFGTWQDKTVSENT